MRSKINKCMNTRAEFAEMNCYADPGDFNSGVEDDNGESTDTDRGLTPLPKICIAWLCSAL